MSEATTVPNGDDGDDDRLPGPDDAYEQGVELSRQGRFADAERALDLAIGRYLIGFADEDVSPPGVTRQRRLALAFWHRAIALYQLGRLAEAVETGRTGVGHGRGLVQRLPAGSVQHSESVAELVTATVDLAELLAATGAADERLALLDDAVELCGSDRHPAVQRALGSALHNRAVARLTAVAEQAAAAQAGGPAADGSAVAAELADAAADSARAVDIRQRLAEPTEPITCWELANSLLTRSRLAAAAGNGAVAVDNLCAAAAMIIQLGSYAEDLTGQAGALAGLLADAAPDQVDAARHAGAWPFTDAPA